MYKMSKQTKKNIFVILTVFSMFFILYISPSAVSTIYNIYNLPTSTDTVSGIGTVTYYDLSSVSNYLGVFYRTSNYASYLFSPSGSFSVPYPSNVTNTRSAFTWNVDSSGSGNVFSFEGFPLNLRCSFIFEITVDFTSYTDSSLILPISFILSSSRVTAQANFISFTSSSFSQLETSTSSVIYTQSHAFPTGIHTFYYSFDFPLIQFQSIPVYPYLSCPINTSSVSLEGTSYTVSLDSIICYTYSAIGSSGGSGSGEGSGSGSFDDSNIVNGLDDVNDSINDLENTLTNGQQIDLENDEVLPSEQYDDAEDNIDSASTDLSSFLDYITGAVDWFPQMWNTLLDSSAGFNPFFLLSPAVIFLILRSILGR